MTNDERNEKTRTYHRLAHALQSGIAMEEQRGDGQAFTPKHLRVGNDLRAADHAAIAQLLIEKGVFTEGEYLDALNAQLAAEVKRHEDRLTEMLGAKITLG